MRPTLVVVAGALLLAAAGVHAEPPAEPQRPWDGVLPLSRKSEPPPDDETEWFACRLLDAETGRPVPGARWIRTPEWIAPHRLRHDAVLGVATADADGVAFLPALRYRWKEDCHWMALAPGYAGAHDYGELPEAETLLDRGEPLLGRVLDAYGDPAAGARVEVLGGCSHGTAMASATVAADGSFSIPRVMNGGQLWVEGRGFEADLVALSDPESLGAEGVVLVMPPGDRYEGVVLDLLGKPVEGAVVRAWNEQRGPTTLTGRDGRFVLEGVETGCALDFYAPADLGEDDGDRDVSDAHADTPMTVVLGPLGVAEEDETAEVVVRTRGPDGKPVGGVAYRLVSTSTGRGPSGRTEGEEPDEPGELPLGEGREDVVPGTYRLLSAGPFCPYELDGVEVVAPAGAPSSVAVEVRPRPRLRVRGPVPDGATVTLVVAGDDDRVDLDDEDGPPLPARERAVVRVEPPGRPPFFFPVGPEKDGVREAVVVLPAPALVERPAGARRASLGDGRRDAYAWEEGDALATDARGPLTLRWTDAEGTAWEVPVDVPGPGATVRVDPARARARRETVRVRVLAPDGAGGEREHDVHDAEPGEVLTVEEEGWRTLRVPVAAAVEGDLTARWGAATLRLRIVDEENKPVAAMVLAGGEVYAAPAGDLSLRGFSAGPIRVVATRPGVRGGVETTVDLLDGETTERTLTLP